MKVIAVKFTLYYSTTCAHQQPRDKGEKLSGVNPPLPNNPPPTNTPAAVVRVDNFRGNAFARVRQRIPIANARMFLVNGANPEPPAAPQNE